MRVFSVFMKIAKKNIGTIILNIGIFIFIASITAKLNNQSNTQEVFNSTKVETAVVDRDHTATSQAVYDYVKETQKLVEIKDDKEVFQDELFYRNVSNIIIIPENFEVDLIAGKQPEIQCISVPGSYSGIYLKMQLNQYLNTITDYLNLGVKPQEAQAKALALIKQETPVTVQQKENTATTTPLYYNYFQFMPYAIIGVMTAVLGMILLAFNQADLRNRSTCSALSLRRQNSQLGLGCLTLSVSILMILFILPIFLYGTDMFSDSNYIYLILNSVCCMFVGAAIGFLAGTISKEEEHVVICSNTFALALNFLGGIFVPLSVMSQSMKNVVRFVPTYWYSTTIETLSSTTKLSGSQLNSVLFALMIQSIFALAIFGIALVITRQRNKAA